MMGSGGERDLGGARVGSDWIFGFELFDWRTRCSGSLGCGVLEGF
jgi:hypothetical protein